MMRCFDVSIDICFSYLSPQVSFETYDDKGLVGLIHNVYLGKSSSRVPKVGAIAGHFVYHIMWRVVGPSMNVWAIDLDDLESL